MKQRKVQNLEKTERTNVQRPVLQTADDIDLKQDSNSDDTEDDDEDDEIKPEIKQRPPGVKTFKARAARRKAEQQKSDVASATDEMKKMNEV